MLNEFISIFTSPNYIVLALMVAFLVFAIVETFKRSFGIFGFLSSACLLAGVITHIFMVKRPMQLFFIVLMFGLIVSIIFVGKYIYEKFIWNKKNPLVKKETLNPLNFERANKNEDLSYMLDKKGFAKTEIKPTGKAQFKEELFEVASQGEYIKQGDKVIVVKVEGSRIIVKALKGGK